MYFVEPKWLLQGHTKPALIELKIWTASLPDGSVIEFTCFFNSEKEEDDNEKREDPGDNWEEGGGGGGGVEKSSGPWNKTAPVQAPPAPVIGKFNISFPWKCLGIILYVVNFQLNACLWWG